MLTGSLPAIAGLGKGTSDLCPGHLSDSKKKALTKAKGAGHFASLR
jgi:hypothetical protein